MVQALDAAGMPSPGTVFSALVARQNDSDTVQFEVSLDEIQARLNGAILDFTGLPMQIFTNVILMDNGNNSITARFSTGVLITAGVEAGIISFIILNLPDMFSGMTSGLLGNFNGMTSDDLIPRGGMMPLSTSSSLQEIHEMFGITCKLYKYTMIEFL